MSWLTDGDLTTWLRDETFEAGNEAAITAANRAAHAALMNPTGGCGRDFTPAGSTATARTVEADQLIDCGRTLIIPDCTEITSIVGASTESVSNYRAIRSGGVEFGETWPYDRVRHISYWSGDGTWGYFTVTAKWGWPATPYLVIEATKVLAKDVLANRDVRLGLVAITEVAGVRMRENPFVASVVQRYRSSKTWGIA